MLTSLSEFRRRRKEKQAQHEKEAAAAKKRKAADSITKIVTEVPSSFAKKRKAGRKDRADDHDTLPTLGSSETQNDHKNVTKNASENAGNYGNKSSPQTHTIEPQKKRARKNEDVAGVEQDAPVILVPEQKSSAEKVSIEKELTRKNQTEERNHDTLSTPKPPMSIEKTSVEKISPRKIQSSMNNYIVGDEESAAKMPTLRDNSAVERRSSALHKKSPAKNRTTEKISKEKKSDKKLIGKVMDAEIDNTDSSAGMQSGGSVHVMVSRKKMAPVHNDVAGGEKSATKTLVSTRKPLVGRTETKQPRNDAQGGSFNDARKPSVAKVPLSSGTGKPVELKSNSLEPGEINEETGEIMQPQKATYDEEMSKEKESLSSDTSEPLDAKSNNEGEAEVIDLVSSSEDESDESEEPAHRQLVAEDRIPRFSPNRSRNENKEEPQNLNKHVDQIDVESGKVSSPPRSQYLKQEEHSEIDPEASICWSCGISLGSDNGETEFGYFIHSHPLLQVPSCSVCADKAYVVEYNVQELIEGKNSESESEPEETMKEVNICSWCADENQQGSNLLLCDFCPRGFCDQCVSLAHGSGSKGGEVLKKIMESEDTWSCLHCKPTSLVNAMKKFWTDSQEDQGRATSIDANAPDEQNDDEIIIRLLDKLSSLEDQLESVSMMLEQKGIDGYRQQLERKFAETCSSDQVQEQFDNWVRRRKEQYARCSDDIGILQDDLDSRGIDLGAFYAKREKSDSVEIDGSDLEWKRAADEELDKRDEKNGFQKGYNKGATGWDGIDDNYDLDLEDLDGEELDRIEEIASTDENLELLEEIYQKKYGKEKAVKWVHKYKTKILPKDISALKYLRKKAELKDPVRVRVESKDKNLDKNIVQQERMSVKKRDGTRVNVIARAAKLIETKKSKRKAKNYTSKYRNRQQKKSTRTLSDRQVDQEYGNDESIFEDSDCILTPQSPVTPSALKIAVAAPLAKLLKPHQVDGVRFMWKNSFSDLQTLIGEVRPKKNSHVTSAGCILAHNMGLGKSLQVVALIHTLLTHPKIILKSSARIINRILLTVPVNTLENWKAEFSKWIVNLPRIKLFDFSSSGQAGREHLAKRWEEEGGVMIITYDTLARIIKNSKINNNIFRRIFQSPGPDVVIIDEGHLMLKNSKSEISKSLSTIATPRRIVLTGTPLQNNLLEFYRMANWIRPGCLQSESAFEKKFATKIMESLVSDATLETQKVGESLLRELFDIVSPYIHRLDSTVLRKELPHIQQAVLHVRQTKAQMKLYRAFKKFQQNSSNSNFLEQYNKLFPVNNHPGSLLFRKSTQKLVKVSKGKAESHKFPGSVEVVAIDISSDEEKNGAGSDDALDNSISDGENSSLWWEEVHRKLPNLDDIQHGGKAMLLLQILAHSEMIGDKVVVFSQCLKTLDFLESILQTPDWGNRLPGVANLTNDDRKFGGWEAGRDYLRIDGQTSALERGNLVNQFNENPKRKRKNLVDQEVDESIKAFLISSRAGSVGINLVAANRVVIFDSAWNPVVDQQALYRCYRYGQLKEVYAYRFLTESTMEEKVYSRSVNKTSLAARVIDQKDPKRNFTQGELNDIMAIDHWVQCDKCEKWRMLPPTLSQAEADALNDDELWSCEMNVYDPTRSTCRAKERDGKYMTEFYQNEAAKLNDPSFVPASKESSMSQASNASNSQNQDVPPESIRDTIDLNNEDDDHVTNTERDEILTGLLQVQAPKLGKKGDIDHHSTSSKSLITKYYFHDSLMKETNAVAPTVEIEK